MKKTMHRILGTFLALAMTLGLLTGCGSSGSTASDDPVMEIMGYAGTTVLLTADGNDITAEEFFFWLAQQMDTAAEYFALLGMENDWEMDLGDMTAGESLKLAAESYAVLYTMVTAKGEEMGYTYTEEDRLAYQEDLANAKTSFDTDEDYSNYLKSMCISETGFEKVCSVSYIYTHMTENMFEEGGAYAPDQETLSLYAEENDVLVAKHILLLSTDSSTGETLSDEELAERQQTMQEWVEQLQAITDPEELEETFDTLMQTYSEDTGLATYPDGYAFTSGEMVEEFEEGTRNLEIGQVSDIIETSYGYHIILRLDPSENDEVRQLWASDTMQDLLDQWVDEAEIVTTEEYDNLDLAAFYDNLTAYRAMLSGEETEETETEDAALEESEDAAAAEEEAAAAEILEDAETEEALTDTAQDETE